MRTINKLECRYIICISFCYLDSHRRQASFIARVKQLHVLIIANCSNDGEYDRIWGNNTTTRRVACAAAFPFDCRCANDTKVAACKQ